MKVYAERPKFKLISGINMYSNFFDADQLLGSIDVTFILTLRFSFDFLSLNEIFDEKSRIRAEKMYPYKTLKARTTWFRTSIYC